jgi:hypothetical protein
MTPHEIELALALRHNVSMLPGSSQKRFARDIAHIAPARKEPKAKSRAARVNRTEMAEMQPMFPGIAR